MNDIVSLDAQKDKKKAKAIAKDLEASIAMMDVSIRALQQYGKYSFVAEVLSSLTTNKTLCEIHLKKYKKLCE